MCTPRISPVALSATTLTKPSVSPSATALPLAVNGNLPTRSPRARSPGLRLGEPDRRDLRPAVGARRHVAVVDRPRATGRRSPPRPPRPRPSPCGRGAGGRPCRRSRRRPSRDVSIVGDTVTKPRSSRRRRAASSPSPRVRAARPTAISTCSASSVSALPSASTDDRDRRPPGVTAFTFTPVLQRDAAAAEQAGDLGRGLLVLDGQRRAAAPPARVTWRRRRRRRRRTPCPPRRRR